MHEGVAEAEEGSVAAGEEAGTGPHGQGHDAVMDHVEEGDVGELFAGDKCELR